MERYYIWVLFLCGCSFDVGLLGPRDSGGPDSSTDAPLVVDDSGADAEESSDVGQDAGTDADESDVGSDAWSEAPDGGTDAPVVLSCTDIPSIAGSYRITRRLMGCAAADYGYAPLTRLDACEYEFDDGNIEGNHVFDGPCDVVVEGSEHRFECVITYSAWRYVCTLSPVSGGLNIDCRFLSGSVPPTTDPCSFFAAEE